MEMSQKQMSHRRNFDGVSDEEALKRSFIRTYSGRNVYPMDLKEDDILLADIIHSLSHIVRYNGHCSGLYTVGQHSVLVARHLLFKYNNKALALSGLLHDSPEAYIGDMPTPLKRFLPTFVEIEDRIQAVIIKRFKLIYSLENEMIKEADMTLLATEARDLMGDPHDWSSLKGLTPLEETITCWDPAHTKEVFLNLYFELTR